MNLDGMRMRVSATADQGVVSSDTRLRFQQKGTRVFARYGGGSVKRGYLIGRLTGMELKFRYVQSEASGQVHAGKSVCEVLQLNNGRTRIVEHFVWRTRQGTGTNLFDELV